MPITKAAPDIGKLCRRARCQDRHADKEQERDFLCHQRDNQPVKFQIRQDASNGWTQKSGQIRRQNPHQPA